MKPEEKAVRELLGRALLGGQIRPEIFSMIPSPIIRKLSPDLQLAFMAIRRDVCENGTCESRRILAKANGDGMKLCSTFSELIIPEIPAVPAIEGAILALSRSLDAMESRTVADLVSDAEPEPEPYIKKMLSPGEVLMIAGPPKAGKSWLTIAMLLSLAAGIPFFGYPIPRPRRVLLLSGEGSDRRIRARLLSAIAYSPEIEDVALERIAVLSSEGRLKIDTPAGERTFFRLSEGFDVVAVDPLYRFQSEGDENSHSDQRHVQDIFDRLKAKGTGLILVHHRRKPTAIDAGAEELRGAGWANYADAVLMLGRKRQDAGNRFLLQSTLRHDEEPDDLELTREGPLFVPAEPTERIVTGADVASVVQEAGGRVEGRKAIVEALRRLTGASEGTIRRAILDAEAKGLLWSAKRTGPGQGRVYVLKEDET